MRHRFSIFLMIASLLLLAVFLVFFLKKTWEDEFSQLKKEISFLFANSIHKIEGEVLDKLITRRIKGEVKANDDALLPEPLQLKTDSLKVMTFIRSENANLRTDSIFNVSIHAEKRSDNNTEMSGSLSMVIALSDGAGDSMKIISGRKEVLPALEANFDKAVKSAGLPLKYRIVHWKSDSLSPSEVTLAGSYFDLSSGEKYAVELSKYKGYLFRQMLPQVLFSLLLFLCVALSFFMIVKSLREQRRLTELKNDFIQNMTHELKTPIATVGVAIEAIQNFDALQNPERTKEYLDISRGELNRLSLLVDKVLRMSQFEKEVPDLKLETIDLGTLIKEVIASMKLHFEKSGAKVMFDADGAGFLLEGDRLHLTSVIYNLLDNALKYSPGLPDISIGLEHENNQIYLRVKDRGMGIPPEFQGRIFEKFFRVPTGTVHNVKGHGLGLNYVASVVKKHGGSIEVESNEPSGTIFKIILPQGEKKVA